MRILLFTAVILLTLLSIKEVSAQGGIGTDGMYVPRMKTSRRDSIVNPSNGQLIYNTDHNCFNVYQKNAWQKLCGLELNISDVWTQKANAGSSVRYNAVGFSIGSKGYIGTGNGGSQAYKKDFWEYEPTTDVWTQKADFGGTARENAVGFSVGSKGYVGTGYNNNTFFNDFWEYNPVNNTWTQKANLSNIERRGAFGFSIGNKGYVGSGFKLIANTLTYFKDFWEYNPANNTWTQKADFGGDGRAYSVSFAISSKGYVGTGYGRNFSLFDFWEYESTTNVWAQKADFAGGGRYFAAGFSIGNKGYIGTGFKFGQNENTRKDFWEYSSTTNSWKQKADAGGGVRGYGVGFSIGSKGYIGTGAIDVDVFYVGSGKDFWEYDPHIVPPLTQQGNQFNRADQLAKLDASGNLNLNGGLNIGGKINNEDFIPATLVNSWINYNSGPDYAKAGFYKDTQSMVRLKGLLSAGIFIPSTVLFILPVGYRPSEIMIFAVVNGNSSSGRVDVYPNGEVRIISGNNSYVSLDNIVFRAN